MSLKLKQGQVWKNEAGYLRIVNLERLKVGYKLLPDIASPGGTHHQASKKEFCRLLKGYVLHDPSAPAQAKLE